MGWLIGIGVPLLYLAIGYWAKRGDSTECDDGDDADFDVADFVGGDWGGDGDCGRH